MQLFVPFEPQEHYFTLQDRFPDAFREIAAFDLLVVNNADRKAGTACSARTDASGPSTTASASTRTRSCAP